MHQVVINIEDNAIDEIYGLLRKLPKTDIKIISDKTMDNSDTLKIADDYIESIENEEMRQLMYELREIRGTGLIYEEDKSDKELLFEAFQMMEDEGKLL